MSENLEAKGHGEKISRKQEQGIAALLCQSTISAAARQAGVGEATLRRWMKEPSFAAAYDEARKESIRQAVGTVQTISGEAVETLRTVMTSPEAPYPSRVTAAKAILENALKAVELYDLETRIKTLEALVEMERSG